jgi:hypothetical protein
MACEEEMDEAVVVEVVASGYWVLAVRDGEVAHSG